jgi:hypothetical protein
MAVSPVSKWPKNKNMEREKNSSESYTQTKKDQSTKYIFKTNAVS